LPTIDADRTQIAQIFQNLIGNAIKFRREGTLPKVCVAAREVDGAWEFEVSDNGIGIEPQYFERIFQIFQRLHGAQFKGTGIGLAICKKIVERHGGTIWVESELGHGTSFHFRIPAGLSGNEET
jgi:signal transduction histidine kinase